MTTKLAHLALGAAGSRLSLPDALRLSPSRYGFSPKIDGAGVYWSTDRAGRLSTLLHRSGRAVTQLEADGLYGQPVGLPDSAGYAELETHTEAGLRARKTRGWAALHVIDCARYAGRSISGLSFEDRHTKLHRWQALTEYYEPELGRNDWWTEDSRGNAHDEAGRFTIAKPRDLRRLPIVPVYRGKSAAELAWSEHVLRDGGEGLVAVRLDAPLGARGSKRKVKATDTIDCVVLSTDGRASRLSYAGHDFVVSSVGKTLRPGMVVSLDHDGWYEAGVTPRFPRIKSIRADLC